MKCPGCGLETRHGGTWETLVGYSSPKGHDHDDNCLKRRYLCPNGHEWTESLRRSCAAPGCDWNGKASCFCHEGPKVTAWSDAEDYVIPELAALRAERDARRT